MNESKLHDYKQRLEKYLKIVNGAKLVIVEFTPAIASHRAVIQQLLDAQSAEKDAAMAKKRLVRRKKKG